MNNLLLVERYILEGLGRRELTISEISKQCGLKSGLIKNVLFHLKSINIVEYSEGKYFINKESSSSWKKRINNPRNKKFEILDLFSNMLNLYYQEEKKDQMSLRLKRAHLDDFEYKVLKSYLSQIDKFLEGVQGQKSKAGNQKTRKEQGAKREYLYLSAESCYPSLVRSSLTT